MVEGRSFLHTHRLALGLILLVCAAMTVLMKWSRPLIEVHTFRQTQTALTAYYFAEEEIRILRPQLPVFGARAPSIPMEFPIYQALVAMGDRLVPGTSPITGITAWSRAVSAVHFLLCGIVGYFLLIRLADRSIAISWLLLWLLTPFSLYWGTSAMIESTALFYAFCSSLLFVKLLDSTNVTKALWLGIPVLLGVASLAFLTKVTTMLIFCPSLAIAAVVTIWKRRRDRSQIIKTLLVSVVGLLIPLLVGYVWVRWGDVVKSENLIGGTGLMSSRLQSWNFGTLAQRFLLQGWKELIFSYHIKTILVGLLALAIPFSWAHLKKRPHQVLLVLPIIVGPLVFTNLYFRHSYYSVALLPSLLLLVAMGCSFVSRFLRNRGVPLSPVVVVTVLVSAGWCLLLVHEYRKPSDRTLLESNYMLFPYTDTSTRLNQETLDEYARITELTGKDDVLVVFGNDWSSETAFYTQRRMVMIQNFPAAGFEESRLRAIEAEQPVASLYYRAVAEHIPADGQILYEGKLFTAITPALAGLGDPLQITPEDPGGSTPPGGGGRSALRSTRSRLKVVFHDRRQGVRGVDRSYEVETEAKHPIAVCTGTIRGASTEYQPFQRILHGYNSGYRFEWSHWF